MVNASLNKQFLRRGFESPCCAGLIAGFKARSGGPLLPFNVFNDGADSRDSGSEQCVGVFKPLGKIEDGRQIVGINEILLAM